MHSSYIENPLRTLIFYEIVGVGSPILINRVNLRFRCDHTRGLVP